MPNLPEPKAGEVWDVVLDPVIGREQGGRRPALVISGDQFNDLPNGLHLIAPITGRDRGLVLHVPVPAGEGGLAKDSVIMGDQPKSISILRFKRKRGEVSKATLERVRTIVARVIER
jgi:mRNA interferase MazF